MLDLIIKYGNCYIDDNLHKKDIAIKQGKITNISDVKISIFTKKKRFLVEKNFLYFSIFANMLIIFS